MHRTTVWLTHDDAEQLRDFACRTRRTMSDVIREGIRLVADSHDEGQPAAPEEIVSPRVRLATDDWMFTPTEEAVLMLRRRYTIGQMAAELALTEAQVERVLEIIRAKEQELSAPLDP
jgi:Arc/MetJ-type ribon-helix-helix transcriptional regulator